MKTYRRVKDSLRSLKDSTDLRISLYGEKYEAYGLNSEYVSNCLIEIKEGHGVPNVVLLQNHNKWIVVTSNEIDVTEEADLIAGMNYPGWEIREILGRLEIRAPKWMGGVVKVYVPDTFAGFEEDGTPIFEEPSTFRLNFLRRLYHNLPERDYEKSLILIDDWEER